MKVLILCVGRLKDEAERAIVNRYLQRFAQTGATLGFAPPVLLELMESKAGTASVRKNCEAAELRRKIPSDATIVVLDERGRTLSSRAFADWIGGVRDGGARQLCIIVGGPDGLARDIADEAALALSLGRMTLPHGLARAVVAEQLYRAVTILARHPYHRE